MKLTAAMLFLLLAAPTFGQELPVPDGAYLSNEDCDQAELGNLDMIGFSVEKGGREVLMYEGACLVATVSEVRSNRYGVELDCREIDEFFSVSFFLDVIAADHIRVDGEDLKLCTKGFLAESDKTSVGSTDDLIGKWYDANENCRGGSGDDPRTEKACGQRYAIHVELDDLGMCYGKEGQSHSQYDWHPCGNGSIHIGG